MGSFSETKHEFIECLEVALNKLSSIWDEIGIVGEACVTRKGVVLLHLHNLLDEMVREEEAMKTRVLENIDKFGKELQKLCVELCLPEYEVGTCTRQNQWS